MGTPQARATRPSLGLPLNWSETENVKWKTEIPYRGWSTPVVLGGQVWLTTATPEGHEFFAICVDSQTGQVFSTRSSSIARSPNRWETA